MFKTGTSISELIKDVEKDKYVKSNLHEGPHISIHFNPSKQSVFINRTSNIKQDCNILGIKNDKLFAPVILKIFGKIDNHYFVKPRHINKGENIGINFDSNKDTLTMFFLVSAPDNNFMKNPEYPANFYEKDFKNFKLTVIYRFFNMPAERMTINFFQSSSPNKPMRGLEWWEVCNLYNDLEMMFVSDYFKKHPERNSPKFR